MILSLFTQFLAHNVINSKTSKDCFQWINMQEYIYVWLACSVKWVIRPYYLAKASFLQDTCMLLGMYVCLFVFYVIIFAQHFLAQYPLHLYNISCIVVTEWRELHWWHHFKVKGQGHIMVKVSCNIFLISFYQINSKLGVKVAYELPPSWLIFGADRPWPSWVSLRVEICLPQGQILKSKVSYGTISCSTSYERSWWVLSKPTKILTLWRHLVTS
jgi:hypothetical protein